MNNEISFESLYGILQGSKSLDEVVVFLDLNEVIYKRFTRHIKILGTDILVKSSWGDRVWMQEFSLIRNL